MIRRLTEDFPTTTMRTRYYAGVFSRSILRGSGLLIKSLAFSFAALVFFAITASFLSWTGETESPQPYAAAAQWVLLLAALFLIRLVYLCHHAAGLLIEMPGAAGPRVSAEALLRWLGRIAPVGGALGIVVLGVSLFARADVLAAPVLATSLPAFFDAHGVAVALIGGSVLLIQSLTGMGAIAVLRDIHEFRQSGAMWRIMLLGLAFATLSLPVLLYLLVFPLNALGRLFADGYAMPLYVLLVVHAAWLWAVTSVMTAEYL